jgi:hypothetical protein
VDLPALQRPMARQVQEDQRALGAGAGRSAGRSDDRWIDSRLGLDRVLAAVGDPDGAVLVDADPIAGAAIA